MTIGEDIFREKNLILERFKNYLILMLIMSKKEGEDKLLHRSMKVLGESVRFRRLSLYSLDRPRVRWDVIQVVQWRRVLDKGGSDSFIKVTEKARISIIELGKLGFVKNKNRNCIISKVIDEWKGSSGRIVSTCMDFINTCI